MKNEKYFFSVFRFIKIPNFEKLKYDEQNFENYQENSQNNEDR